MRDVFNVKTAYCSIMPGLLPAKMHSMDNVKVGIMVRTDNMPSRRLEPSLRVELPEYCGEVLLFARARIVSWTRLRRSSGSILVVELNAGEWMKKKTAFRSFADISKSEVESVKIDLENK